MTSRAHTHTHTRTHAEEDDNDAADETYVPEELVEGSAGAGADGKKAKKPKGPRKLTEKQLKKEQMELQKKSSKMFRETAAEGCVLILMHAPRALQI